MQSLTLYVAVPVPIGTTNDDAFLFNAHLWAEEYKYRQFTNKEDATEYCIDRIDADHYSRCWIVKTITVTVTIE
jgi:hypothetical protein